MRIKGRIFANCMIVHASLLPLMSVVHNAIMMMKRILSLITLAAVVVAGLNSCGSTTTGEDEVQRSDAAYLSTLKLGVLKRTLHTTSSTGDDSSYMASISLINMPMVIDHNAGLLYNARPLPVGTDLSRVNFSAIAGSGLVGIKSIVSGIDTAFTPKDTFDLRQPREVFVVSTSGKARHTYRLSLTVAETATDSVVWAAVPMQTDLQALTQPRLVAVGDTLHLFGQEVGGLAHYTSTTGEAWLRQSLTGLTPAALPTIMAQGDTLWAAEAGALSRSTDAGRTWQNVSTTFVPAALLGTSSAGAYVAANDQRVYVVNGTAATTVAVEQPRRLPLTQNNSAILTAQSATTAPRLIVVGRNAMGDMVTFTKQEGLLGASATLYPLISDFSNGYSLPQWTNLHLAAQGRTLLAVGLESATPALAYSRDGGLTWQRGGAYILPQNMMPTAGIAFASATEGRLWLVSTTTNQVWRGQQGM